MCYNEVTEDYGYIGRIQYSPGNFTERGERKQWGGRGDSIEGYGGYGYGYGGQLGYIGGYGGHGGYAVHGYPYPIWNASTRHTRNMSYDLRGDPLPVPYWIPI